MKKKLILPVLLLLCLFGSIAYAKADTDNTITDTITLTDENRYNPVYYQEPEELYPAATRKMARSTDLSLEEYIVSAIENFQEKIDVSAYEIPIEEAEERYLQIINSHPELFYVGNSINWSYSATSEFLRSYSIEYTDTPANIREQKEQFNREAEQALTRIDPSMTPTEKALVLHDYLVLDCEYDYERLQNDTLPELSHSAYGALVNKMAVCDGYASAYSYLLGRLGISSTLVSSDSMDHAWNMVLLDDKWYHVDVTWDDPVPDLIGRASHNFFLLSDTVISDSDHRHNGWDTEYTADSNTYNRAFWTDISSAFCYQNGSWYYAGYSSSTRKTDLLQREGHLLDAPASVVFTENGTWNNYLAGYMYLDLEPVNGEIYFNTRTEIRKLDSAGNCTTVYTPECPEGQLVFGFTLRGARLCYALQDTPNITDKQVVSTYTLEDLLLPQITGITAKNLETDYDGTAKLLQIEGTKAGDKITYRHEDGSYKIEQPEIKNAGTYLVSYKVERDGYEPYIGVATITIREAQPAGTQTPDHTQTPTGTQTPDHTQQPAGTQTPDHTQQPAGTQTPDHTQQPADTQKPDHTQQPAGTQTPDHTQQPASTQKPDHTQQPVSTQKPDHIQNTVKAPAKVKSISVKKKGKTKVKITWKKVTGASGYEIFMRTGKGKYKKIKTITKGKTVTFTKSRLKRKKRYSFRIRAYKKSGSTKIYGSYSNVKTIKL